MELKTFFKIVDAYLGIYEQENFAVNQFPNPVGNQISIKSSNNSMVITSISIGDKQGKLVASSLEFKM